MNGNRPIAIIISIVWNDNGEGVDEKESPCGIGLIMSLDGRSWNNVRNRIHKGDTCRYVIFFSVRRITLIRFLETRIF